MPLNFVHRSPSHNPPLLVTAKKSSGCLIRQGGNGAARPFSGAKPLHLLPPVHWLDIEQIGDVTLVRFVRRRILTEETIEIIAGQLFELVEREGHRKLILNFANIDRLATAMLGKLMILQKSIEAVGGRLVVCHIAPHLVEIFSLLNLPHLLGIYRGEMEALEFFQRRPLNASI